MPPIKELGGRLYLGGLRSVDASGLPDLNRIFLVGRLGGSYQGYQVIFQSAFTLQGPIGMCLDVNAGAAGIPLGPTGFLFTGASGGMSFVNNNGDPCDFETYFASDAEGNLIGPSAGLVPLPTMNWDQVRSMAQRVEAQEAVFRQCEPPPLPAGSAAASRTAVALASENVAVLSDFDDPTPESRSRINGAGLAGLQGEIDCPGDCPPATVNILCQPHPDQDTYPGKVIAKFTSIDAATLASIGIDRARVQAFGNDSAA